MFVGAIMTSTDNYMSFVSGSSIVMVVGGTLAATFIGYQGRYVILALKDIGGLFIKGKADRKLLTVETGKIIRWGYLVKKSGLLALEKEIKGAKSQDHFLSYGIELVITGYSGEEVRGMLGAASNGSYSRAMVQADILQNMAAAAPAFGMIGTLVGLIVMLQSLTANPDGVGDGLAVAMLTTLYGVLVARLVFIPAASKISQKEGIMRFRNFLITEGFAMLAEQKSPRFIQDKMNSYLDPSMHYNIAKRVERRTNNGRRPTRRKNRTAVGRLASHLRRRHHNFDDVLRHDVFNHQTHQPRIAGGFGEFHRRRRHHEHHCRQNRGAADAVHGFGRTIERRGRGRRRRKSRDHQHPALEHVRV